MAYRPHEGRGSGYRRTDYDNDARMYDDQPSRADSRDRDHDRGYDARSSAREYDSNPRAQRGDFNRRSRGWDSRGGQYDSHANNDDYQRRHNSRSPPRRGRGQYRDRDREGYHSPGYDDRSRSRSRERGGRGRAEERDHAVPPSREVMLEGLGLHVTEDDISSELAEYYQVSNLDDVRIIRDRQTKKPRGFGFIRFATLDQSIAFVDKNAPEIYIYGSSGSNGNDQGARVRITYTREREDRGQNRADGDWICQMCTMSNYASRMRCFRCQAPKTDLISMPAAVLDEKVENTGDNDASPDNTPSQFLLLRGLEPSVSEEVLVKGVSKLYKPSSSQSQGTQNVPKKSAKVASTTGDSNLGAREGSIRRIFLVRDRRTSDSWRYGFAEFATVEDAQNALIRYNSFEKFTISSKPVLATYIHAGVFVPVLNPTASTERYTFSPLANPSLKLAYWDEGAYVAELVLNAPGDDEIPSSKDNQVPAVDKEGLAKKDSEKSKKRKPDGVASSGSKKAAVPSHLQFWSDRHAELHGKQASNGEGSSISFKVTKGTGSPSNLGEGGTAPPPSKSYADLSRLCCYLCYRQFQTAAEVNKHERLSRLHRDNLKDDSAVSRAERKLEKHQVGAEYRDRARERRKAFGVEKRPAKPSEATEASPRPSSPDDKPAAPSKGASLLGKMGWSAGTGLGASGEGMTAPIVADAYVAGVGLGAEGGKVGDAVKEAERSTRGRYGDFLEQTREKARERFENLKD